ncbi:hypothetical protein ACWCRD_03150 [Streptomyces sp. NPDC002092]
MDDDLAAVLAGLSMPSLADIERMRREAEQAPPAVTTIPQPDFPIPFGGVARFHCPLDCGWRHDEGPDVEPMGPLLLPAGFTSDDVSAAISAQADVRANNFRLRVELAISEHFDAAHPGR